MRPTAEPSVEGSDSLYGLNHCTLCWGGAIGHWRHSIHCFCTEDGEIKPGHKTIPSPPSISWCNWKQNGGKELYRKQECLVLRKISQHFSPNFSFFRTPVSANTAGYIAMGLDGDKATDLGFSFQFTCTTPAQEHWENSQQQTQRDSGVWLKKN